MKLRPACEVESCIKDRADLIKICDSLHVELCTDHCRSLRRAVFLDEGISSALEVMRGCQDMAQLVIHSAKDSGAADALIAIEKTVTTSRADVYRAIMDWLLKEEA